MRNRHSLIRSIVPLLYLGITVCPPHGLAQSQGEPWTPPGGDHWCGCRSCALPGDTSGVGVPGCFNLALNTPQTLSCGGYQYGSGGEQPDTNFTLIPDDSQKQNWIFDPLSGTPNHVLGFALAFFDATATFHQVSGQTAPAAKFTVHCTWPKTNQFLADQDCNGGICTFDNHETFAIQGGCDLVPAVTTHPFGISLTGQPTHIGASFTPKDSNGNKLTIEDAASRCGFEGFNWQQTILTLAGPSQYVPNQPGTFTSENTQQNLNQNGSMQAGSLQTPPAPPIKYDPIDGGYRGFGGGQVPIPEPKFWTGPPDGPYPFYSQAEQFFIGQGQRPDDYTITFGDSPANLCRPLTSAETDLLGPLTRALLLVQAEQIGANCFPPNPLADYTEFETDLVGVLHYATGNNQSPQGGSTSTPLSRFRWKSNFLPVVSSPGVGGLAGSESAAPEMGVGGITITDLNGVPQTPPTLTCAVTPSTLWPPNGKSIAVTVSGSVTQGTQPLTSGGSSFSVFDEYGQYQLSGSFALDNGGGYSFKVPLIAARNGTDLDGRTYIIIVATGDMIGNLGSCSAVVTVPHDQQ